MSAANDPVLESELHALCDGALPVARRMKVEDWLADQPAGARRVAMWRLQNEILRAAYEPALLEPIPLRLSSMRLPSGRLRARHGDVLREGVPPILAFCIGLLSGLSIAGLAYTALRNFF
jgi:anti-sigma factor RsiW